MPNIDASDYIRRRKLTAIKYANDAASQNKFRALTRFDSYDPSTVRATGAVCNDACRTTPKNHDIFAAQKYSADKVPHFGKSSSGGGDCPEPITIDLEAEQLEGSGGGFYVCYTIPEPTQSITFRYTNIPDNQFPEIDSADFDFANDESTFSINCSGQYGEYNDPYFSTYAVWTDSLSISNGDTVTLTTNSPISGTLYIGYYLL